MGPRRRVADRGLSVQCVVRFPRQWVNASKFETALRHSCGPHDAGTFQVNFEFPTNCKVMVDAAIRPLSLVNQLASTTRRSQEAKTRDR